MPHIVFENKIDLNDFLQKFSPIFQRDSALIKIQTIFVDKDNFTALLPTVVIDENHQEFLIELSTRKEKTTIRLYPNTDPEKTDGVKIAMALLAKQIMNTYPDFKITKTNLSNYLEMIAA
ncbi:hypothetical protein AAA799B03_00777 [Marine Group I thaumarchaeote SCGC AAA799-B03]|uniref:Uncharacterized protein n=4 Tax=Marine Group I TaxID=905826 RepID=A0A087S7B8_9ARCH|nr:hypothetical protein AAA799N04_00246 [Marine Group I thaumarchaeote SCGC AAA799-N04]KFM16013.1 hypothetical protein AAA799D11_00802 [Marine Group I thaumarchaeote SCGC AAA799-D11]KFM17750.1 hypothetical protein SCCGRSA3_01680 [Marine Group I thaumarchaeote SCGC RSA3]KFM21622.1 hypothetical protein AAA799B03_00777 [Marine Group I thaumarchaeote SCGC AAA799-B03]